MEKQLTVRKVEAVQELTPKTDWLDEYAGDIDWVVHTAAQRAAAAVFHVYFDLGMCLVK